LCLYIFELSSIQEDLLNKGTLTKNNKYPMKFPRQLRVLSFLASVFLLLQGCATMPASIRERSNSLSIHLAHHGATENDNTYQYTSVKEPETPTPDTIEARKNDEKYLYIEKTAFDVKSSDIRYYHYRSEQSFRKKTSESTLDDEDKANTQDDNQQLKIDNTIFTDELNKTLRKTNFIDTLHTIFPNTGNCMFINATVKKISIHRIYSSAYGSLPSEIGICAEMEILWELLDFYKQKLYTITTSKKSGIIWDKPSKYSEAIDKAIEDNLEYSFISVRKEFRDRGLLTITGPKADTSAAVVIDRPTPLADQRMNDFMKSVVTLKVDDGHGSGVVITRDGMIVTNYHVVAGTKKIEVIFKDGSKADADVVKTNADADLALIKVKKDSLVPLVLSEAKEPEIGIDVWAIGTPKSLELGQSVSKGIISGVRNANGMTYIQIDVKVSPGNSGGALINKEGKVLGIVSSKLIGFGTEGVGFAILSDNIFSALKLKYK